MAFEFKRNIVMTSIFILFLGGLSTIVAGAIQVSSQIDPKVLNLNETFIYTIIVSGGTDDVRPVVDFPEMKGAFEIIASANSTSVSVVNGKPCVRYSLFYRLRPLKTGRLTMAPVTIHDAGHVYTLPSVQLQVAPDSLRKPVQKESSAQPLFLRSWVEKTRAYPGEPIVYKLSIDAKKQPYNVTFKPAVISGFLIENKPVKPACVSKQIRQDTYYEIEKINQLLIPIKPGRFKIPASRLTFVLDPFSPKEVTVVSEPVMIQVIPFPKKGKPIAFSGICGDFSMTAMCKNTGASGHVSITMTMVIKGNGYLKQLHSLSYTTSADTKVILSKITDADTPTLSQRSFDYTVIPQKSGVVVLPVFRFDYFSLKDHTYQTLLSETKRVLVEPAKGVATPNPDIQAEDPEKLDKTAHFFSVDSLKKFGKKYYSYALILAVLGILALGRYVGNQALNRIYQKEMTALKKKQADQKISACLDAVHTHLNQFTPDMDSKAYLKELHTLLLKWISEKWAIQAEGITHAQLKTALQKNHVAESIIQSLIQSLDQLSHWLYAPLSATSEDVQALIEDINNFLGI